MALFLKMKSIIATVCFKISPNTNPNHLMLFITMCVQETVSTIVYVLNFYGARALNKASRSFFREKLLLPFDAHEAPKRKSCTSLPSILFFSSLCFLHQLIFHSSCPGGRCCCRWLLLSIVGLASWGNLWCHAKGKLNTMHPHFLLKTMSLMITFFHTKKRIWCVMDNTEGGTNPSDALL